MICSRGHYKSQFHLMIHTHPLQVKHIKAPQNIDFYYFIYILDVTNWFLTTAHLSVHLDCFFSVIRRGVTGACAEV